MKSRLLGVFAEPLRALHGHVFSLVNRRANVEKRIRNLKNPDILANSSIFDLPK